MSIAQLTRNSALFPHEGRWFCNLFNDGCDYSDVFGEQTPFFHAYGSGQTPAQARADLIEDIAYLFITG